MLDETDLESQNVLPSFHPTDLGPLPEEWEVARLGSLIDTKRLVVQNGFAQGEHNQTRQGVPHLRPFNVSTDARIDLSQIKYVAPPPDTSNFWVRPGDIVFNNTNSEELVGKAALFSVNGKFVLSNHMTLMRVVDTTTLDAGWLALELYYLWTTGLFQALCRRHVNQASISLARLRDITLPLPPLPEQRAIAHVLRAVQRAKEATEQVIAATRELKRSLMHHLFTYGPVPVDQADQVPLKETDYGMVPGSWSIVPLTKVASIQTGTAKGRRLNDSATVSLPYLRVANVQDGFLDLSEVKYIEIRKTEVKRFGLKTDDVLLTEGGDFDKLGRGFIWKGEIQNCIHQNHIFAVRADKSVLQPEYLAYVTQSEYGKRYFLAVAHRTTHLACINSTKLKALPVPLPPKPEQQAVVDRLAAVDLKREAMERRRVALDALLNTLLRELMTGKRRVSDAAALVAEVGG